jgi:hypothetical protein
MLQLLEIYNFHYKKHYFELSNLAENERLIYVRAIGEVFKVARVWFWKVFRSNFPLAIEVDNFLLLSFVS